MDKQRVRVVGIGASAGGLEALERFFEHVPSDSHIAWIVVQHLSPDHKSLMAEILGKRTHLPVKEVVEDEELKPGHVYLGPARSLVAVEGKAMRLKLRDRASGLNLPIDALFRSMAEQLEEDSVGVVLSGTGSDGRSGLEAIKDAGGLVVAQDPTTARFDGMPLAAVSTGLVDLVLPPEAMPEQIARVLEDGFARSTGVLPPGDALDTIFAALKKVSGIDFSEYKPSTVGRRIERRMGMLGLTALEEYSRRVADSSSEALLLSRELLINVTRFFRDEPAFEVLKATAVEDLVRRAQPGDVLRVWVAACSTGQEAYTVGMILAEAVADRVGVDFKIFATDIDRAALDVAGAGVYSDALVGELTHERLARFFSRRGEDWQVNAELRRHIVFAPHNLTRDPPFTRLDLVSCRNVLIYLSPNVQKRVLAAISFAIKPDAFLMLGTSETLGDLSDRYRTVDQQWRICQRLPTGRGFLDSGTTVFSSPSRGLDASSPTTPQQVIESAFRVLIDRVAQAAVLVNQSLAVVAVYGNAESVLKVPLGAASLSVLAMLPPELRTPVTVAFHRAMAGDTEAVATVADGGTYGVSSVRCIPIAAGRSPDRFVVVVFERPHEGHADGAEVVSVAGSGGQLNELQQELQVVRDRLQSTVEQLETSNEELQAANEELLAANEELQSTNEELQSVNEELNTVNAEHREKIRDLTDLNADLDNMFKASTVGTVFLDDQLTIRRFTPALAGQFNVLDRDIGRPITDLSSKFVDASFIGDLEAVVEAGGQREREVRTIDGRTYLMRILPFLSDSRQILGAVVTFADITVLRQAQGASQTLQRVVDSLPQHVAVLDGQGEIRLVNRAWTRFAEANGAKGGSGIGSSYLLAAASEPKVRQAMEDVLAGRLTGFQHEYPCHTPTERRWFRLYVAPLEGESGAVVSHVDITARVESDPEGRIQVLGAPPS